MAKNDHFHESGKVGRSSVFPVKLFPFDFYDLKSLSFKFGNGTFITFEMPMVSYRWPAGKINILLLFRPSVIRGPWVNQQGFSRPILKCLLDTTPWLISLWYIFMYCIKIKAYLLSTVRVSSSFLIKVSS